MDNLFKPVLPCYRAEVSTAVPSTLTYIAHTTGLQLKTPEVPHHLWRMGCTGVGIIEGFRVN